MEVSRGQEDYIWAMRDSVRKQMMDAGEIRRVSDITKRKIDASEEEIQTKVMASLVPDEVIFNVNDYSQRNYEACLFFGDVSGFTELAERYSKTGQGGPSRLTSVLNKYLGTMVQEIMSYGGDILKFSGDAFLAWWKVTENEPMRDAVHECLDCALVIQKQYGTLPTDVGVTIRVKLAISAGPVIFSLIGDDKNSHYVIIGKPIWDVKAGEAKSVAGDIIVSPSAWRYTNANEYIAQEMSDGVHMKIVGVGPNWRSVQKGDRNQKTVTAMKSNAGLDEDESISSSEDDELGDAVNYDEFVLRPAVNIATRLDIKFDLRKFIILPVMKSIDMNEPFEYLTEMRQVVIVFINIVSRKLNLKDYVRLADDSYRIVCQVVNEKKGCVNKVSLFDKDLMIVVVFGLRGLKHELECQLALKAAAECHQKIGSLEKVYSVSIGVTTGKTYCGVVGHTLRREYTVISLTVNKAARLMVNYKDKVTCDRETFLHSKMEARNFIAQEYKKLKGISKPGPVYEFKELPIAHDVNKISSFPILGRNEELKTYLQLLDQFLDSSHEKMEKNSPPCKMLLIKGDARIGKTRILEEYIYDTPMDIPVNRVTFAKKYSTIPFYTTRLIFCAPLGMTIDTPPKEKEGKLRGALRKMKVPDLLCVLNEVFGVRFKVTALYASLDDKKKKAVLRKMIRQLYYGCFLTKWVFVLDNIEYIDSESWEVFDVMFDIKVLFVVASMSKCKRTNTVSDRVLADRRVKHIQLKGINRWYHGGLACQIMDVAAIPAELEKAIQSRSNGNAGWIESFLICLIQDSGLYIMNTDAVHLHNLGLLTPPLYMMQRLTPEQILEWKCIMEEKQTDNEGEDDDWKKYVDICREEYLDADVKEKMESKMRKHNTISICMCSSKFDVADIDPELSLEFIILKTFDSLSSYEQLFVKCSSILGNQFLRQVLIYVMAAPNNRQMGLAVKKLFEMKVLTCAKADFQDSGNMVVTQRLQNPDEDEGPPRCECRGLRVPETCIDLPRYASCGFMQYRNDQFRNIAYNLLTDNQKKEFHHKALRYLEKETRKCRSCGSGFFENILGDKTDEDIFKSKHKRARRDSTSTISAGQSQMTTVSSSAHERRMSAVLWGKSERAEDTMSTTETSFTDELPQKSFSSHWLGIKTIKGMRDNFALTRVFSNEDFTDCQCNTILTTTYAQVVEHCKGAANWPTAIEALIQYAEVCIISFNIIQGVGLLEEAIAIITAKKERAVETEWKEAIIRAKIHTNIGSAYIELGEYDKALVQLYKCLELHKVHLPRTGFDKKLSIWCQQRKHLFGLYIYTPSLTKSSLNHWEKVCSNDVSMCLSELSSLFIHRLQWEDAALTAYLSLTKALESFSSFKTICLAYTNAITVAIQFEKIRYSEALEVHALRFCHLKLHNIDAEELKVITKLYCIIFRGRFFRNNVDSCIHIGYIVLRIGVSVHAYKTIVNMLPLLARSLIMGKHFSNAIALIREMDFFALDDSLFQASLWYYSMCMDFHIETGHSIVTFESCEHYSKTIENEIIPDHPSRKRFHSCLWLWAVRTEKWDEIPYWETKIGDCINTQKVQTLADKYTMLQILEGYLLLLVYRMDTHNIVEKIRLEKYIEKLLKFLYKVTRLTMYLRTRLYMLWAYYILIRYNDPKANAYLKKARKNAIKIGTNTDLSWIEHNRKAWNGLLSPMKMNQWKEHCDPDNLLDYQEIEENNEKIVHFTLPLPKYF